MGDIYIKDENGEKVAYEKGFLTDRKIGTMHEKWDGSYETRNIWGDNVTLDGREKLAGGRNGTYNDNEGEFRKGTIDKFPKFRPNRKESEDFKEDNRNKFSSDISSFTSDNNYNTSFSKEQFHSSKSTDGKYLAIVFIIVYFLGVFLYASLVGKADSITLMTILLFGVAVILVMIFSHGHINNNKS